MLAIGEDDLELGRFSVIAAKAKYKLTAVRDGQCLTLKADLAARWRLPCYQTTLDHGPM